MNSPTAMEHPKTVNPYGASENNDATRQRANRHTLSWAIWIVGVTTPAIAYGLLAIAYDQSRYGASNAILVAASAVLPTLNSLFNVSPVFSPVLIICAIGMTSRPFGQKIGAGIISAVLTVLVFFVGVVASLMITGLPVD